MFSEINCDKIVHLILCIDSSGSTEGYEFNELNSALYHFFKKFIANQVGKHIQVELIQHVNRASYDVLFRPGDSYHNFVGVNANGTVNTGAIINKACERFNDLSDLNNDISYTQIMFLLTDGRPTLDLDREIQLSKFKRYRDLIRLDNSMYTLAIGMGELCETSLLAQIDPNRTPLKLRKHKFDELFNWLFQVIENTINSFGKGKIPLPPKESLLTWADL